MASPEYRAMTEAQKWQWRSKPYCLGGRRERVNPTEHHVHDDGVCCICGRKVAAPGTTQEEAKP